MKRFLALMLFLVLVSQMVFAYERGHYRLDLYGMMVRSDSAWDNSISADVGDYIDIKASAYLGWSSTYYNFYEYDKMPPPAGEFVEAWVKVEGFNGKYWQEVLSTLSETKFFYPGETKLFQWDNLFSVNEKFEKYRVTVNARITGDSQKETETAYIYVVKKEGDCGDIEVFTHSLVVNEDKIEYDFFSIDNHSGKRFYIDDFYFEEKPGYESLFDARAYQYDSSVSPYGSGSLEVKVEGFSVTGDELGTALLKVAGHFEGGYACSYSDIGVKQVGVKVRDTGGNGQCGDISLEPYSVHLKENRSQNFTLRLRNDSSNDFYVENIDVWDNSPYLESNEYYYDRWLYSNGYSDVEVRLQSKSVSSNKDAKVFVRVEGHFIDGRNCSYNDVLEDFPVFIEDTDGMSACDDIRVETETVYVDEDESKTERFTVRNYGDERFYVDGVDVDELYYSSYFDLYEKDWSERIYGGSTGWIDFRVKGNPVSSDRSGKGFVEIKGHFSGGETCSFSEIGREEFTVRVRDTDNGGTGICSNLELNVHDVSLDKGETVYEKFRLRNDSSQNFYIDSVDAYDYSGDISVSAFTWDNRVDRSESGNVTVKVKAYDSAETGTYAGYVKVKGHFTGGRSCSFSSIGTKRFEVTVKGESRKTCDDFRLTAPEIAEVSGTASISILIDNPTDYSGTIKLSGKNLSIEPETIVVSRDSSFERTIKVELLENKQTYLVYDVDLGDCGIESQSTKIFSSKKEALEIVSFPASKTLTGTGTILVKVRNNSASSRKVVVSIEGLPSNWEADTSTKTVGAGDTETFRLEVTPEGFGLAKAELVVSSKGIELRKGIEFNSVLEEELIEVETETIAPLTGNDYEVKVRVKNNSEEDLEGEIDFVLPSGWEASGDKSIELKAGEEKEFSFTVTPDKDLSEEEEFTVTVDFASKGTIESTASLKPKSNIVSTGLALIGENLVGAGLVVIIIILAYALIKK